MAGQERPPVVACCYHPPLLLNILRRGTNVSTSQKRKHEMHIVSRNCVANICCLLTAVAIEGCIQGVTESVNTGGVSGCFKVCLSRVCVCGGGRQMHYIKK